MNEQNFLNKIKIILGGNPFEVLDAKPRNIFDKQILSFLGLLSKNLMKKVSINKELRDFAGFIFWIRKANLNVMKDEFINIDKRYGRGVSFHITPSHIAINSLYSFVFSLLSGSPCLLRISNTSIKELTTIFEEVNKIVYSDDFIELSNFFSFISYEHSDDINQFISARVSTRLIWGGDRTIKLFKKYETKPSCIDLPFPNRVSSAIITSTNLINQPKKDLLSIARKFALDISIYDQLACSSPFYFYFINKENNEINKNLLSEFFKELSLEIKKLKDRDSSELEHFKSSAELSIASPEKSIPFFLSDHLTVIKINKEFIQNFSNFSPSNSCLIFIELNNFDEILNYINSSNQTFVNINLDNKDLNKLIKILGPSETSRIVSPGNALNMHNFWEGYNIVSIISKEIKFI